jgi:hypothetical protein
MPFLFPPTATADLLLERLRENNWRGEIVGPHGSGKSALLATLLLEVGRLGRQLRLVELRDAQHRLPAGTLLTLLARTCDLLAIDGFEQLPRWRRRLVRTICGWRRCGLLVTAHRSVGLPLLCRTAVDIGLAQEIVAALQRGYPVLLTDEDVADQFARHRGDMRETLFALYDLYAERSATSP